MNKKGMEIAINHLVTIILGIIVLAGGIVLFKTIIENAVDQQEEVKRQIEVRIMEELQSSGAQVFIYPDNQNAERGKTVVVGVGINNIQDTTKTFYISIDGSSYPNVGITQGTGTDYISVPAQGMEIQHTIFFFPKNADRKEYSIPVRVYNDAARQPENQYGDSRVIKITVV